MIGLEENLLIMLGISMGVNILIFFIAFAFKTDKLTDITYSLTFITLLFYSFFMNFDGMLALTPEMLITKSIIFVLVLLWAIRIGYFLMLRIHKFKVDGRFDKMRSSFVKFFGFFFLQGASVYIIFFPAMMFLLSSSSFTQFSSYAIIGAVISLFGLIYESIADQQKLKFKLAGNKGFISSGLWKTSRHPNYFGEMLFWAGILIITLVELLTNTMNWLYLLLIIPGMYIPLLLNLLSGVPLLELRGNEKFKSKEYEDYCKKTPIIIPYIGSKGLYTQRFHLFRKK